MQEANAQLVAALAQKADREQQRYVGIARAAKMLNLTQKTVRKMLKDGRLDGMKTGKERQSPWLVDVLSIERYMRSN